MHLHEVLAITDARLLTSGADLELSVQCGLASDLMSDVLRLDLTDGLLVTGLANQQVVRTAEMADAAAILLVRGKDLPAETVALAERVGIPVLATNLNMFESCGRLFRAGLQACAGGKAGQASKEAGAAAGSVAAQQIHRRGTAVS